LPSDENAQVTPKTPAGQSQATPPPVQTALARQVYLQLAAYDSAEMADDLKARLLLMGLDPITQRVELADKRIVHRIRIGPFTDSENLKAMRARLISSGFPNPQEVSN